MYGMLKSDILPDIEVDMFWEPLFYTDFEVFSAIQFDSKGKSHTNVNPSRIINEPLSGWGQELEHPVKEKYEEFLGDCRWLIRNSGFTVITESGSEKSNKSQYVIVFGIEDNPCGEIVFNLRISAHPLKKMGIPDKAKEKAMEYLKANDVLNGKATAAGIDFAVYKVIVGGVRENTWNEAAYG